MVSFEELVHSITDSQEECSSSELELLLQIIKLLLSDVANLSIEYLAEQTIELDKLLYNYLPHSIRTTSLSGFIAMQIIYSFIYDKKAVDAVKQYSQKISAITIMVENYLPIKWKGINLQFWIDKLFSLKNNFNRDQHEANQSNMESKVDPCSLQEILELAKLKPFSENIQRLFQSCDEINTLFENFKEADGAKKMNSFRIVY